MSRLSHEYPDSWEQKTDALVNAVGMRSGNPAAACEPQGRHWFTGPSDICECGRMRLLPGRTPGEDRMETA